VRFPSRVTAVSLAAVLALSLGASGHPADVRAVPNPVATSEAEYLAYGRVFSDPHGCLVADSDGDGVNDVVPPNVSPWAKGNMCMAQYLSYEEAIEGTRFLARKFPRYLSLIRLDQAYDNPNFQSAGIPRAFVIDDGLVKPIDRDKRPLYLIKVTDSSRRCRSRCACTSPTRCRSTASSAPAPRAACARWKTSSPGRRPIPTRRSSRPRPTSPSRPPATRSPARSSTSCCPTPTAGLAARSRRPSWRTARPTSTTRPAPSTSATTATAWTSTVTGRASATRTSRTRPARSPRQGPTCTRYGRSAARSRPTTRSGRASPAASTCTAS
jgi:hypothetical protein